MKGQYDAVHNLRASAPRRAGREPPAYRRHVRNQRRRSAVARNARSVRGGTPVSGVRHDRAGSGASVLQSALAVCDLCHHRQRADDPGNRCPCRSDRAGGSTSDDRRAWAVGGLSRLRGGLADRGGDAGRPPTGRPARARPDPGRHADHADAVDVRHARRAVGPRGQGARLPRRARHAHADERRAAHRPGRRPVVDGRVGSSHIFNHRGTIPRRSSNWGRFRRARSPN